MILKLVLQRILQIVLLYRLLLIYMPIALGIIFSTINMLLVQKNQQIDCFLILFE